MVKASATFKGPIDVRIRQKAIAEMFSGDYFWLTDEPAILNEDHLMAIIVGVQLPRIVVHERDDGATFEVLEGGALIESIRAYMKMGAWPAIGSDNFRLDRRLRQTVLDVVVYRCTMSRECVKKCLEMVK